MKLVKTPHHWFNEQTLNFNLQATLLILIIFFGSPEKLIASPLEEAPTTFNTKTGELYWDISERIRIKYLASCEIYHLSYKPYNYESILKKFLNNVDFFNILSRGSMDLSCNSQGRPGLVVVNRLRSNGSISHLDTDNWGQHYVVSLNGNKLHLLRLLKEHDNQNYQHLFAALQLNKKVIIQEVVLGSGFRENYRILRSKKQGSLIFNKLLNEKVINISEINNAEVLTKVLLQKKIDEDKENKAMLYESVLLYAAIVFLVSIIVLMFYLKLVHPIFKRVTFQVYCKAKELVLKKRKVTTNGTSVIKSDKFTSYSVADEILKWAKMRDEGIVSEEEFEKAKDDMLD